MDALRSVFFVSDRTGITVEALGRSLLAQFAGFDYRPEMLSFVDNEAAATEAVARINAAAQHTGVSPLVFSTLTDPAVRTVIMQSQAECFDLLGSWLAPLERVLGIKPCPAVGLTHGVVDLQHYTARMDAVNFALAADDGCATQDYARAEVILVGLSRSGKTPTSLYLAMQYGLRVANYPLTEEDLEDLRLPAVLEAHRARLYALTIEVERLQQIRSRRRPDSRYASVRQCQYEVRQVEALYRQQGLKVLNTTWRSVEEIAASILRDTGLQSTVHFR